MTDEENTIDQNDLRLVYTGAATVLTEYALGPHFDFHKHSKILRQIAQGIEKLMIAVDTEIEDKTYEKMGSYSPGD